MRMQTRNFAVGYWAGGRSRPSAQAAVCSASFDGDGDGKNQTAPDVSLAAISALLGPVKPAKAGEDPAQAPLRHALTDRRCLRLRRRARIRLTGMPNQTCA